MKASAPGEYSLSLETVLASAALLYFIKCSLDFPFDPDLFMMLRTGWEMVHHGLPVYDTFAWPPLSCKVPWVDYQWLAHVIIYTVYSVGGFTGTVIYKTILYGASFFVLFWWSRGRYGLLPSLAALLVAVYLGRWFLSPRPMAYSAVFFPLLAYLLIDLQQKPLSWRHFLVLPLMFVFWGNLHGGFVIGLVIMGAGFALLSYQKMREGAPLKGFLLSLGLLWLLCFLGSALVNPYGWKNFRYVIDFLYFRPVFMRSASDMESPFLRLAFNTHYFAIIALTIAALILFFMRYRLKPSPMELLIYCFWLVASLRAARNMQLFSTASIPMLSFIFFHGGALLSRNRHYQELVAFFARRPALPSVAKIAALFFIILSFTLHCAALDLSGQGLEHALFPVGMKDFLLSNDLPERLYCHDIVGTYFLWYLYPRYKVSIDVRWNNVYTDAYFEEIQRSFFDSATFFRFVEKHDLDVVVVHYKYHPAFIERDSSWVLLYEGERARLFLRNTEKNREILGKFWRDELAYPDIPDVNAFLYRTFIERKNYEAAKKYLRRLIIASPGEEMLWRHSRELDRLMEKEAQ
ncbi:MAG: hypothetical protein RDV48_17470 [Candidatus Eremiobacteraeota bacterium]|nr:hypothetical protein [Candidatus Eremiobacteraeota bacterium]